MVKGETYFIKDIKYLVKDVDDPYVTAYKIGKNNIFYDIKSRTGFAKFLQYFLGFVTVS